MVDFSNCLVSVSLFFLQPLTTEIQVVTLSYIFQERQEGPMKDKLKIRKKHYLAGNNSRGNEEIKNKIRQKKQQNI